MSDRKLQSEISSWSRHRHRGFGNILSVQCSDNPADVSSYFKDFKAAFPKSLINELTRMISEKVDENSELRDKVNGQAVEIDELKHRLDKHERLFREIFDPSNIPVHGTFENWRESGEPVNPFRGKHVAFVSGIGVIASSDTLDGLMERLEKTGRPKGLIIGFVPVASAFISKC